MGPLLLGLQIEVVFLNSNPVTDIIYLFCCFTGAHIEKYILISGFLALLEVKILGKVLI